MVQRKVKDDDGFNSVVRTIRYRNAPDGDESKNVTKKGIKLLVDIYMLAATMVMLGLFFGGFYLLSWVVMEIHLEGSDVGLVSLFTLVPMAWGIMICSYYYCKFFEKKKGGDE